MKRLFLIAALFLFATTRLIASFDFSSVSSSGHTLYYRILNQDLHTVYVTYPGSSSNPYNNYIEPSGNLVIPSSVAYDGYTYTVVMIGEYAFSGCDNLLSVVIPSTVTEFGNRSAFSNCESLVSVNIPSGVRTISPYTFSGCYSLPSIQLPDTLRVISPGLLFFCRISCCSFLRTSAGRHLSYTGRWFPLPAARRHRRRNLR